MRTSPKRTLMLGLCAVLAPALALAAAEAEVTAAHDARLAATIRGDVAALAAMMTDDLTYTHSSGVTETRTEFLQALASGKYVYRTIEPQNRRVRVFGDAAAVSGPCHIVIEPGGKRTEINLYFTEVYVKKNGRWLMALWHSTRLPPAASETAAPVARP